jgi:mannitol-specific phosphotransferase system IIBC component
MRRGRLLLLIAVLGWLVGCGIHEPYEPYTLMHPRTGATVTCGHWIWWECAVVNYMDHGYERLQTAR